MAWTAGAGLLRKQSSIRSAAGRPAARLWPAVLMLAGLSLQACQNSAADKVLDVEQKSAGPVAEEQIGSGATQVVLLATSGVSPGRQRDILEGARLAMEDLGETYVSLHIRNGGPDVAASAAKAASDGAAFILGPMDEQSALLISRTNGGNHPPVLAFTEGPMPPRTNSWGMYSDGLDSALEGIRAAIETKQTKFTVLYPEGMAAGDLAQLRESTKVMGGTVLGTISYPKSSGAIAAFLQAHKPMFDTSQSIVLLGSDTVAGPLLEQLAAGVVGQSVSSVIATSELPESIYNRPAVQGVILAKPADPSTDIIGTRYERQFGHAPSYDSAIGYDAVAVAAGLARAARGKAIDTALLTSAKGFRGLTGLFRFRSDGTTERRQKLYRIEDGRLTLLQTDGSGF
jgi:substrate-binding family protein